MSNPLRHDRGANDESGFALILALLTLMVLTFLGMALATTTSTELQIATNYRWSQQAYYNAEAGAELGKRYLQQYELRTLVGDPREASAACAGAFPAAGCEMHFPPSDWTLARLGPSGEANRNWENSDCDTVGGAGYGNVFDHPSFSAPFQNTTAIPGGLQVNGTFTIWVRRGKKLSQVFTVGGDDRVFWEDSLDSVILTVEGTAPYVGNQQVENRAVRYIEIELQRIDQSGCENYAGQIGSGPSGANYDQCGTIGAEGLEGAAGGPVTETDATLQ